MKSNDTIELKGSINGMERHSIKKVLRDTGERRGSPLRMPAQRQEWSEDISPDNSFLSL